MEENRIKKAVIGILAHVDSGKTTLSEALLYKSGAIRKLGRVDHADAFLDTDVIERERGITIFSKQAVFQIGERDFTLLDTPGHVDFSGEAERVLAVLDAAVLVISACDGVQSHTRTLWRLLKRYDVPTIVFINKSDMPNADVPAAMRSLSEKLGQGFVNASLPKDVLAEEMSMCSEALMNEYLETGEISEKSIARAVAERQLFPCVSGSALKLTGVEELMELLGKYCPAALAKPEFSARVFKISEDKQGARLTNLKITGGSLSVRDSISYRNAFGEELTEKISRLKILNGEKSVSPERAEQGDVCAVAGLSQTYAGQALGAEKSETTQQTQAVLRYAVFPPEGTDEHTLLRCLRVLEQEDPTLAVSYSEQLHEITVSLMGEIQREVLGRVLKDRFSTEVTFGEGRIAYRETVAAPVDGAGHFEPLRHYAEVHIRLEPLPRGSGVEYASECSEDVLARHWQRLILTNMRERQHKGVLTRSPVTDVRIVLTAGRAHIKHTEGGDFRQAVYRAVRQALRKADSVLLEPYYAFRCELPQAQTGRALTDLEAMGAKLDPPDIADGEAVITGTAPVSKLRFYHSEIAAYTAGAGSLYTEPCGYGDCLNARDVIAEIAYDPDSDLANTADSVFCSHGAGHVVPWYEADALMHVSPGAQPEEELEQEAAVLRQRADDFVRRAAENEELMKIFERTYGKIDRKKPEAMHTPKEPPKKQKPVSIPKGPEYLLVDGYNIIFAWEELKRLAAKSLDLARSELINRLSNYQGFRQCQLILVFDAYKVPGSRHEEGRHGNISIVYTAEAETADTYIERTAHHLAGKKNERRVRVATSDGMEQVIIMGSGALRVSAAELHREVEAAERAIREYIESM